MAFVVGTGDKIKLYVGLLPKGSRTKPTDFSIVAGSGLTNGATTISVSALGGPIAKGTPLFFEKTSNGDDWGTVYTSADVAAGATSIPVEAIGLTTTNLSLTCAHKGLLRLLGGTSTGENITNNRVESYVFEDTLGFADGAITTASLEIPFTGNLLSSDDAYRRVLFASLNAVDNREIFVSLEKPAPAGYTNGDKVEGAFVVSNLQTSLPSDNIITYSLSFNSQGSPTFTRYS